MNRVISLAAATTTFSGLLSSSGATWPDEKNASRMCRVTQVSCLRGSTIEIGETDGDLPSFFQVAPTFLDVAQLEIEAIKGRLLDQLDVKTVNKSK